MAKGIMKETPSTETGRAEQSQSAPGDAPVPPSGDGAISAAIKSVKQHPLKIAVGLVSLVVLVLIGVIIYTSHLNTNKYYLQPYAGALEVWQGTFSPAGKKRVVIMPGVRPPAEIKPIYSQQEVYPIIFNHYLEQADALIHAPGVFDFADIKIYLDRALEFATYDIHRAAVKTRLNRIDRVILYYKADVAASKGSIASLEAAVEFLDQAASLGPDEIESELISKKKQALEASIKNLKAD
jgi:hypothetical protein